MTRSTKWEIEKGYKPFERREDHTLRQQLEERNKPEIIDRVIKQQQNHRKSTIYIVAFIYAILLGGIVGGFYYTKWINDLWKEQYDERGNQVSIIAEELCKEKGLGKLAYSESISNYLHDNLVNINCEKGNIILEGVK